MNYIGSKKFLLEFIDKSIKEKVGNMQDMVFCDLFAGCGCVGEYFKNRVKRVIANDIEYYAYILIYNKIKNTSTYNLSVIEDKYIAKEGFIYEHYALKRGYFSKDNARKIDGIRELIEKKFLDNKITQEQYCFCLASLLFSADKVANTTGVYGSFLKKLKYMAKTDMKLLAHEFDFSDKNHEVYNEDANVLIHKIEGDILYLDPPYNHRQYGLNYHILNSIVLNKEFKPKGVCGYGEYYRSKFCQKTKAKDALESLICDAQFKYIFLSYSDDGILDKITIEKIMSQYGLYERKEYLHSRLRVSKKSKKGQVIEYLHILEKNEV